MDQYTDYVELTPERLDAIRARQRHNMNGGAHDGDTWLHPDLSLLGSGRRPAPPCPLSVLGSFWADWVERRAHGASAPVDYVVGALLASAGALLANVRRPLAGAEWSEPPLLWIGLVGSPSAGKSPAMDPVLRLAQAIEDRWAADFSQELLVHEGRCETAKVKREAWEAAVRAAVKDGSLPPLPPEDASVPEAPVRPRVRVADATTEKLAVLAAALPRGLLLMRDELAGWLGAFDRYGGCGSDRAFAIEMYGGRSYTVDRMKSREPVRIRHLAVGVLGGIQPDRLSGIVEGPDDGLAARFLWIWPEAVPQFRLSREVADDRAAHDAFERLSALPMGSDAFGNPEPVIVRLSRVAEEVLEAFARTMADRADAACGVFAGALGKARGQALRLATVLEFLWWCGEGGAEPTEISEQAVRAACHLLLEFFVPMAERVFCDAWLPVAERNAMALARHLEREGLREFNARTLRDRIGGALRDAPVMAAACAALVEAGLIRARFSRAGESAGRKALNYEVNPAVFGSRP